jgi:hypothetical protein
MTKKGHVHLTPRGDKRVLKLFTPNISWIYSSHDEFEANL